jgi:hypothetical protein
MTQSKAADVYAIPTLRRQFVSYLPRKSLATVIRTSKDLMQDAIILLYSEVDSEEVLDMMHSGCSRVRRRPFFSSSSSAVW